MSFIGRKRKTRKRGGATTYTRNLERGKAMLRELKQLLESELANKTYLTNSHKQQLVGVVEEYIPRIDETMGPVPADVRRRDREYIDMFDYVAELVDGLDQFPVGGRR